MTKFSKRHKEMAHRLHDYFLINAPSKFLPWERMTEEQKNWWYNCAATVSSINRESEKKAA